MAPNRQQAITWVNDDPVHWCIYAALGGDELREVLVMRMICLDLGYYILEQDY